jgi:hypothetical protein
MAEIRITAEDENSMKLLGITSKEKFLEARKSERDYYQARRRAAPTATVPKPKASSMTRPCEACQHSSPHSCSASSCTCTDPYATDGIPKAPDGLSASDVAICARLGISQSAFLRVRREEARP